MDPRKRANVSQATARSRCPRTIATAVKVSVASTPNFLAGLKEIELEIAKAKGEAIPSSPMAITGSEISC
jgi:hypothetical protein